MRAALSVFCYGILLREAAISRARASFVIAYFFEFGEPAPGRGASRSVCDSVWLRRDFVAVGETCYACYLAGVDFMLPFCTALFLCNLKYAWARGVCPQTPVGLFFVGRRGRGQKLR